MSCQDCSFENTPEGSASEGGTFRCVCGLNYCAICGYDQGKFINEKFEWCKKCKSPKGDVIPLEGIKDISKGDVSIRDIVNNMPQGWKEFFEDNMFLIDKIDDAVNQTIKNKIVVYPPIEYVFNAFYKCSPEDIKVVIIGQDCYHGEGQAMGLSFSVNDGIPPPPSLINIFKELESDGFAIDDRSNGNLTKWTEQGVFMYNKALTVEKARAGSHLKLWQTFSEQVIKYLNFNCNNLVFILWGKPAKDCKSMITQDHYIIESVHPSPLSAHGGFFGSKPFSKTNTYLEDNEKTMIDWNL